MLLGRKTSPLDSGLVRVIAGDTKGGEQSLEFQEHRILPGADDVGKHFPAAVIKRMPEPPCSRFGPDKTPHLIELGGALWPDADGTDACTRGHRREVDLLQHVGFFLIRR